MSPANSLAPIRFSERAQVFEDIADGIVRNVSIEAALHTLKDVTPKNAQTKTYLATSWEPAALAIVARGAARSARININASGLEFSDC